jgi:hypothetical protein
VKPDPKYTVEDVITAFEGVEVEIKEISFYLRVEQNFKAQR